MTLIDKHILTVCRSAYVEIRPSALSDSTWLLKQRKLSSVPLFSSSWTIVALFCLAARLTLSADYRIQNSAAKLVFKARKRDRA